MYLKTNKIINYIRDFNNPNFYQRTFLISFCLFLCLCIIYREQFFNGFTLLFGERYDCVIQVAILEHWFKFFSGDASWTEMGYYFPHPLTIANSDALFLNGLVYAPFRLVGLDPFISGELSSFVIKSVGFVGLYLLCRKVFSFTFYWALLASVLFTLSNGMTAHNYRVGLSTVAFSPVMAILLWSMFKAFLDCNMLRFRYTGLCTGLFYGAWCLTNFYMAWFFTYFIAVFTVVVLVNGSRFDIQTIKDRLMSHYGSVIFVIGSVLIALLPFAYAFLSKAQEVGTRRYEDALYYTVPLEGILQVGNYNLIFGKLYNFILKYISPTYLPRDEYYNTGFSIVLFLLFLIGCVKILKNSRLLKSQNIILSVVITTLITWVSILNISGHSAWFFIFHIMPGANALRVVSAYQVFLALPVVIIALKYLSTCRLGLSSILIVCSLLIVEEINRTILELNPQVELNRISIPHLPPKDCRVFYVSGWSGQEGLGRFGDMYAHNVTAILLAQFIEIPTINGIASFNQADWNFDHPNKSDYDERIFVYSKKHGITNLCKLDLNSKKWTSVSERDIKSASLQIPFYKKDWPVGLIELQGLYLFEPWGTWSSGDVVTFEFGEPLPENFNVHLTALAFGPNVGKEFVALLGEKSVKFTLSSTAEKKVLEFANPKRLKLLKILVPSPASPYSIGMGGDGRNLGIGFVELSIQPVLHEFDTSLDIRN